MERVRLIGEPTEVQNNYKYYKSFSYIKNGIYRSYLVGEFFFTKKGGDPLVGEIIQILEKNDVTKEVRVGFYIPPEKSTYGPKADSGEHEVYASEYDVMIPLDVIPDFIQEEIELERSLIAAGPEVVPDDPVVPDEIEGEIITGDVINKGRNLQCQKIKVISYKDYNRYRTMLRRLDFNTENWMMDKTAIALGLIPVNGQKVHFLFCRYYCFCPNLPYQNGREPLISNFQLKYKKLNRLPEPKPHVLNQRSQYSLIRRVDVMQDDTRNDEQVFLQRLFKFMKIQNTPIHRVPSLGFKQIDLFRFYKKVQRYGGYDQITNKRLWKNIYDSMGGDPGSTSAATCTRKHYERLLLSFEKHLCEESMLDVRSSILQEANIDNIQVPESAAMIQNYKPVYGNEDAHAKSNKTISLNKKSVKNPPNGELSILKNMLGFNGKIETENFETKRNASLKIKLEKMPKQEHGKMKEFWQKKAIIPIEEPVTNPKLEKEDRWNSTKKKYAASNTWEPVTNSKLEKGDRWNSTKKKYAASNTWAPDTSPKFEKEDGWSGTKKKNAASRSWEPDKNPKPEKKDKWNCTKKKNAVSRSWEPDTTGPKIEKEVWWNDNKKKNAASRNWEPNTSPKTEKEDSWNDIKKKNDAASMSWEQPDTTPKLEKEDWWNDNKNKNAASRSWEHHVTSPKTEKEDWRNDPKKKNAISRSWEPNTSPKTETGDLWNDIKKKNDAASMSWEQPDTSLKLEKTDWWNDNKQKNAAPKSWEPDTSPNPEKDDMWNYAKKRSAALRSWRPDKSPKQPEKEDSWNGAKKKNAASKSWELATSPKLEKEDSWNGTKKKNAASRSWVPDTIPKAETEHTWNNTKKKNAALKSWVPNASPIPEKEDTWNDTKKKNAAARSGVPDTSPKSEKEDTWNDTKKKNAAARSVDRIQKTPKPILIKQEPSDKSPTRKMDSILYQNEIQKKMLFNLLEFRKSAHVNEKPKYNVTSSSALPSGYNVSNESPKASVVQERSVDPKAEIPKPELQPGLENKDIDDDGPSSTVKLFCPFSLILEKNSNSQTEASNENAAASSSSDAPQGDNESKEEANVTKPSSVSASADANEPISSKPEDPNLPHLHVVKNNNSDHRDGVQSSDSNGKVLAENQNPSLPTPAGETFEIIKFSDPLLHQRPSVILHTEQIRSPPPIPPPVTSKVTNGVIANNIISRRTLISQNPEQFVNSLKLQQPQVENKIVTKQFYDPVTKQLHDLPIVEPMVSKSKITSNTPSAKKKGTNSKKSFDSGYGRADPCDKIRNTVWKNSNNARKNVTPHSGSNKAGKRKKSSASNQNNSAKATPVLSVPLVEPKKIKLSMPVVHSSPYIQSPSKFYSLSFKLAPFIHRNAKICEINEPIDLSMRSMGRGRNRRLPTNNVSDMMGLDLSLKKGNPSAHANSISCGIENITPPPVTALRDASSLFGNGLDYIPSVVRKKFQQAFLETKALSIPHNKGPQSSTPVSQMPSTSLKFISRNHPLYSVPISSNSSRYPVHSADNDPCFKPNAYMSPLWASPSYETKASMPQLAPHVDTKPFSFNHLPPQLYPYVNSERQYCNEQQYFVPQSK